MSKLKSTALGVSGIALGLVLFSGQAQAAQLTGGVSLSGGYTAFDNVNAVTENLSAASIIDPTGVTVSTNGLSGDFMSLLMIGDTITHNDFQIAPLMVLPGNPLWTSDNGNVSFDLNSIQIDFQSNTNLNLSGSGEFHDLTGAYDDTLGDWNFTANSLGSTFSFSSSHAANPVPAPNALLLMGLGVALLGGLRIRKTK